MKNLICLLCFGCLLIACNPSTTTENNTTEEGISLESILNQSEKDLYKDLIYIKSFEPFI